LFPSRAHCRATVFPMPASRLLTLPLSQPTLQLPSTSYGAQTLMGQSPSFSLLQRLSPDPNPHRCSFLAPAWLVWVSGRAGVAWASSWGPKP